MSVHMRAHGALHFGHPRAHSVTVFKVLPRTKCRDHHDQRCFSLAGCRSRSLRLGAPSRFLPLPGPPLALPSHTSIPSPSLSLSLPLHPHVEESLPLHSPAPVLERVGEGRKRTRIKAQVRVPSKVTFLTFICVLTTYPVYTYADPPPGPLFSFRHAPLSPVTRLLLPQSRVSPPIHAPSSPPVTRLFPHSRTFFFPRSHRRHAFPASLGPRGPGGSLVAWPMSVPDIA
eukprot:2978301-Rhodomonas_salina.3